LKKLFLISFIVIAVSFLLPAIAVSQVNDIVDDEQIYFQKMRKEVKDVVQEVVDEENSKTDVGEIITYVILALIAVIEAIFGITIKGK